MTWKNTPASRRANALAYGSEYRRNRKIVIAAHPFCTECGSTENLTTDHVVPVHIGGGGDVSNLRVLCSQCHRSRTGRQGAGIDGDPDPIPVTAW